MHTQKTAIYSDLISLTKGEIDKLHQMMKDCDHPALEDDGCEGRFAIVVDIETRPDEALSVRHLIDDLKCR